jgi:hypothetical protein
MRRCGDMISLLWVIHGDYLVVVPAHQNSGLGAFIHQCQQVFQVANESVTGFSVQ